MGPATDQRTALSDLTSSGSELSMDIDEEEDECFDSVSARMYHSKNKKKKCKKYSNVRVKRSEIDSCATFKMQSYVEPEMNATFLSNFPDSSDDDDVNL